VGKVRGRPLSWSDIIGLSLTIAEEVRTYRPTVIIAIMRGGIYPALIIASRLGIDRLYTVEFRRYSDEKPPRDIYGEPKLLRDDSPRLDGERVLIVDDVARTGSTLRAAMEVMITKGVSEVRSAVLIIRSQELVCPPDYYATFMSACPLFPWE